MILLFEKTSQRKMVRNPQLRVSGKSIIDGKGIPLETHPKVIGIRLGSNARS
jgi:hypothetical protein